MGDYFYATESDLADFFKKPWWVGVILAGFAMIHPHAESPTGSVGSGAQRINASGMLPRYGKVVVVATCPSGKQLSGGGYMLPSTLSIASSSRAEPNNAWRVAFKSLGGSGDAQVYAICTAKK